MINQQYVKHKCITFYLQCENELKTNLLVFCGVVHVI